MKTLQEKKIEKLEELVKYLKRPISEQDYFWCREKQRLESELSALELLPLPSDDKQEKEQILHEFAEKFNMKSIHDDPELAEASGRAVNEMLHESVQSPSKESSEQERTEETLDLGQYVTNLLYAAANEGPTMSSIQFDNWVEKEVFHLMEYTEYFASQSNKVTKPGVTDTMYEALYNPMIYESSAQTLSIHRTPKGAEMAIAFHKEEARKEWLNMYPTKEEQEEYPFGHFEWWGINEIKIMD